MGHVREQVYLVLDFENVRSIVFLVVWNPCKIGSLKSVQIVLAKFKDRTLVVADHRLIVSVDLWPLLKLEFEVEHLTFEQRSNRDTLFY
jgi:hypothetical protein